MNPVIYFDELDKISDTPKGEEITGILTHLTDTTQNSQFHDKYFSEIDFDLSKCIFVFSYNDESRINPILRDRMYRIQTKGYDSKEKTIISQKYILPKIRQEIKFRDDEVTIEDNVIKYIIEKYTQSEDGMRNLKRCLEVIHTKLNLCRLMKPGENLFAKDIPLEAEFPFTVTNEVVAKLIKPIEDRLTVSAKMMYL
jgi:ATP-dependent Lon protease